MHNPRVSEFGSPGPGATRFFLIRGNIQGQIQRRFQQEQVNECKAQWKYTVKRGEQEHWRQRVTLSIPRLQGLFGFF
jgi:hypothetical protein